MLQEGSRDRHPGWDRGSGLHQVGGTKAALTRWNATWRVSAADFAPPVRRARHCDRYVGSRCVLFPCSFRGPTG